MVQTMLVVGKYYRFETGDVYKVVNINVGKRIDLQDNKGKIVKNIDYDFFLRKSKPISKCKIYYNVNRKAL